MTLAPGAKLGSYEILSRIGAGGMGEVYRASDTKLKRDSPDCLPTGLVVKWRCEIPYGAIHSPLGETAMVKRSFPFLLLLSLAVAAWAQSAAPVPVTVDNFIRALTDRTFAMFSFGKIKHNRELSPI